MKNSVELKQERAGFITEANEMLELCKNETRNFTSCLLYTSPSPRD